MARVVITAVLIVILNVMAGCSGPDKGRGQIKAPRGRTGPMIEVGTAAEADLIEQVAINRQAYQRAIEMLVGHYEKTGNAMKSRWAKKELDSLNKMVQYDYIIDATVAGPELRATASIPEADELYNEAVKLHKDAKKLVLIKDKNTLRLALAKYNEVIRKHPASDKIDDAAFKAGEIYEYFKDYSIALVYFQRTYQWNAAAPYPARFRAAAILDRHLHNRAEAQELYKEAIEIEAKDGKYATLKDHAERRVDEINKIYKPQPQPGVIR
jgi:tetratricopeptide (TPR) repeat protein